MSLLSLAFRPLISARRGAARALPRAGRLLVLAAAVLSISSSSAAVVYKWTDAAGTTHFSDTPPEGVAAEEIPVERAPARPPAPGSSGLRSGERKMLREFEAQARERAEQQAREAKIRAETAQQILGSLVLNFRAAEGGVLPPPDLDLQLIAQAKAGGDPLVQPIGPSDVHWLLPKAGGSQDQRAVATLNFSLSLRPGEYLLQEVRARSPEMGDETFSLPLGARLTVPLDTRCLYVGRLLQFYLRLPAGSREEQRRQAERLGHQYGRAGTLIYLEKGGFVLIWQGLDVPRDRENRGSIAASKEWFLRAREQGCAVAPASL